MKKITVVIPCHNEAGSIAEVIAQFQHDQLAHHGLTVDLLVVDNNSTDDTATIARQAGATVITETKQGKGNALRTGFANVTEDTDYVVMLDGDNTYSPAEVLRVVEPLQHEFCDVVIGSRLGGHINATAMNRTSRIGNRLFTTAVRALYGANVTDVLTGYFAWKKSALDQLLPHIKSEGFAVEMEMITKMARLGHTMAAVPISYNPRVGQSHLHPFSDGWRILVMLLKNLAWRPAQPTIARPRRIVFVSDTIYPYMKGGKEKRLHEIAKGLVAMGNDVHVYTMHWWPESSRTKTEDGIHLHAISKLHALYKGDRRTIAEGVLFGLACFKLLWVKFDIIDVDHMPFFPIFSSWIVCKLRFRKMYATWHEALSSKEWLDYMGPSGIIASVIERISIRLPHHITAASAHTRDRLAHVHGRVKRVELVASGIDTDLIAATPPADEQCDVLFVGRLVKDKHVDTLLSAISLAKKYRPTILCHIIGHGPERQKLERLTKKLSLTENVQFIEPLPETKDIYARMKAARVFCSPSVREGFGIVSLEALACGTPVITMNSPHNAARHLIREGIDGSVIERTPQTISRAILQWIQPADKPTNQITLDDYDWQTIAQKQAKVYSQ